MAKGTTIGAARLRWGTQEFPLPTDGSVAVGRDSSCDIVIEHPLVSRHHFEIVNAATGAVVRDLGSSNGTFVDGTRIDQLALEGSTLIALGHPTEGPVVAFTVSSDRGPLDGQSIGRDPDNDIVVDDLMASRHHAELVVSDGSLEVVDLGSQNGTYVNGTRVSRAPIRLGDVVNIGKSTLVLGPEGLRPAKARPGVSYAALDLRVVTPQGKVILDGISFALDEGSFLGVVGPSGSGKSTLVNALTGFRPATEGSVFFSGRDLYTEYEHIRQRIGYVPQDDVLHMELTVGQTLEFAAELRFPSDVSEADREQRIAEVLEELGLVERREVPVANLSGGQRKRVSVALELLTRPSLLILDEPTSGLDPGYERSLMELLANLARAGRTIIVVTHSVQSLHLCDRILCLAPGGRTAWFGPPDRLTKYFGRADYQEVFRDLSEVDGAEWKARFEQHPDHAAYVVEPMSRYAAATGPRQAASLPRWEWFRQFKVLTRRRVASIFADKRTLTLWLGLAVVLGLLLLVALPEGELGKLDPPLLRLTSRAPLVVLTVVLGVTELGAFNTIREIVDELPLYRRERAVGLSISAYVASKTVVFGVVTIVQTVILTVLSLARQNGPEEAVILGWPFGEMLIVLILSGLAAMALGLLVSAAVDTVDRAMTFLPIIFVLMMVLAAGGIFPTFASKPGIRQASFLASSHWGFAGVAATVDLNNLNMVGTASTSVPVIDVTDPAPLVEAITSPRGGQARFSHTAGAWLAANAALLTITIALLIATAVVLRRHDGG